MKLNEKRLGLEAEEAPEAEKQGTCAELEQEQGPTRSEAATGEGERALPAAAAMEGAREAKGKT